MPREQWVSTKIVANDSDQSAEEKAKEYQG